MPLQNGQTLGHYRILRPLGAGGMGEVYEAEDTKLGRRVALKILPEETARDPQRRERFEREAKAIAALSHPGIVTIHSVERADGIDFITMELLEGRTLRRILAPTGLSFDRFLDIAVPLAEAMGAAHERGITHRDLKPENILIGRDGKPKVVDFGLAKRDEIYGTDGEGSRAPTRALTEEGRIVGTVAYMSPEQAEGKPVDPRSDVFALGIILYEMATGERPFKGDTTVSVLSSILKDTPPPVTQSNATLPRDAARIVNRCLMKDPARRFQSGVGLATELAELKRASDSGELAAVTGTAAAHPTGGLSLRGPGRGSKLMPAAAIAAALLAAGALGWWAMRGRGGPAGDALPGPSGTAALPPAGDGRAAAPIDARRRIVVLPFENLGAADDAYFADGVTEEITSRLAAVGGLGVISRNSAVQYAKTTKSTRQIGSELNVDYVLSGTVRWQRGGGASRVRVTPQLVRADDDTQVWGERYEREMKDIFAVQSEIAEQVVSRMGIAMRSPGPAAASAAAAPTGNLDAYQLYLRGKAEVEKPEADRETMLGGIDLLEQAVRLDPDFSQGWAMLSYAHSLVYNNRYDYSEQRLARARECVDRALALQPDLREARLALGYYYYWGRRDYVQAAGEFKAAAGGRPDDPEALAAMAYMLRRQGKWDEALAAMQRAFALNPRDYTLVTNLMGTYKALGRYEEMLSLFGLAEEVGATAVELKIGRMFLYLEKDGDSRAARAALMEIDPGQFAERPGLIAFLDLLEGRHDEALAQLRAFPRDILENQTFYAPKTLFEGEVYLAMNDRRRAAVACEAARQRLEKDVAASPRDPRIRTSLGRAFACLGRRDEALREARLAVDLMPVTTDALDGPDYLEGLAIVHAMLGDSDAAIDVLEKVAVLPGGPTPAMLKLDPALAPLRGNPRFAQVLKLAAR